MRGLRLAAAAYSVARANVQRRRVGKRRASRGKGAWRLYVDMRRKAPSGSRTASHAGFLFPYLTYPAEVGPQKSSGAKAPAIARRV